MGGDTVNFVADFETTTKIDDCRVWGWGLGVVEQSDFITDIEVGTDLDSFIERMMEGCSNVYFHNLKFDGTFIIDWLFRNGFEFTQGKLGKMKFTTLISSMGQFYSIKVMWSNGKTTTFKDSYKKLPYSVSDIAKAFNLEEAKGKIDYKAERPIGHRITDDEREYIALDVLIVCRALRVQFAAGLIKLTVGSDALHEFKTLMGSKMYSRHFPILSDSLDREIREAYKGGFTYCDIRNKGKEVGHGKVYDVNSLYPHVMRNTMLPYGEPTLKRGVPEKTEEFPLYITNLTFVAKLRKNHIPCIQIKNNAHFSATEYLEEIKEPTTLSITNVDYELWEKHYEITVLSFNYSWHFKGIQGLFNDYVDKWMAVKEKSKGGMRALAKLQLNSLYGKFATNPDVTPKIPTFQDNRVKFVMGKEETREPVYTAMGAFITAEARKITITAAQDNYDTFLYADTDSLHLSVTEHPTGLDIDPTKLGAWKHEYNFTRALFVRAKTYIELKDDGIHETHIAGLNVTVTQQLTLENFTSGKRYEGNLKQKIVPGGIVLMDSGFTAPTW